MTRKEQSIDLVERLDEVEAAEALDLLWQRYARSPDQRMLPGFVGMGHSGRGDLGRRAKDIVRDELGVWLLGGEASACRAAVGRRRGCGWWFAA